MTKLYKVLDNLADRTLQHNEDIERLNEVKADKAVVSMFDKRIKYIYENNHGQDWDIENDTGKAYTMDVPGGAKAASVNVVGGQSVVSNQLIDTTKDEEDHTEAYSKTLPSGTIGVGVNMIGGKSIVKNQKIALADTEFSRVNSNVTFSSTGDGIITINGTSGTGIPFTNLIEYFNAGIGHKLLLVHEIVRQGDADTKSYIQLYQADDSSGTNETSTNYTTSSIITTTNQFVRSRIRGTSGGKTHDDDSYTCLIDLTRWFNGDSTILDSITTPEDAYALGVPREYIPYNADEIISADCDAVVSTGFNLWDEEWEVGSIDGQGNNSTSTTAIRSKNYVPLNGASSIYLRAETGTFNYRFYDSNKNFISGSYISRNSVLSAPANAIYIRFYMDTIYGTTYNNDICINVSQPDTSINPHNGQYLPYLNAQLNIPAGLREEHPLRSAGTAYDEYRLDTMKFIKSVYNLGSDGWQDYTSGTNHVKIKYDTPIKNLSTFINKVTSVYTKKTTPISASAISYEPIGTIGTDGLGTIYVVSEETPSDIYYADEPTEIDISSYFPTDTITYLPVEDGGSLTFHQTDTEFPLPNSTFNRRNAWTEALDSTHKYLFDDNGSKTIVSNQNSVDVVGAEDNLIDLTKMFGADAADITSVADAYALGAPTSKTAYDAGTLVSADCEGVVSKDSEQSVLGTLSIPQELRTALPLKSSPTAHDDYDFEKLKCNTRVGARSYQAGDESDATVITDGTNTQYALDTPTETDISSYFAGEDFILDVEDGGTITFRQDDATIAVPYDIDYLINTDAASI